VFFVYLEITNFHQNSLMANDGETPGNPDNRKRTSGSKDKPTAEPVGENEKGKEIPVTPKGKQKQVPEPPGNASKGKEKQIPEPPGADGRPNSDSERIALIKAAQIKCHDAVQHYRKGTKNKILTILEITAVLGGIPDLSSDDLDGALTEYLGYVDEADREKEKAEKRGRDHENNEPSDDDDDDDESTDGKKRSRSGRTPYRQNRHSISRSRSPTEEPKRKKTVPPSSMPWLAYSILEEETLKPELKLTLRYLRDWAVDPKFVRASITNSAACPDFPYSEWGNIINGRAVNLDQVFSAFYTTSNDNRHVTQLGNLEITSDAASTPSKIIKRDSEWRNSWEKAEDAYCYLMPHRGGELKKYGRHITKIFFATNEIFHYRVIQYDKAVRAFVASRRDVLLGDYEEFADIRMHHIDNLGSGHTQTPVDSSQKSQNRGKSANRRKNEVCHRYNKGHCPGSCGRLHVCNSCKDPSHVESDCPKLGKK
jgi:hypothetical protein